MKMKRVRIILAILLCVALSVPVISNAITIYPFGSTYLYTGDANLDGKDVYKRQGLSAGSGKPLLPCWTS